jgi:hypothetical protein
MFTLAFDISPHDILVRSRFDRESARYLRSTPLNGSAKVAMDKGPQACRSNQ